MILYHNALYQLNILQSGNSENGTKYGCLYDIIQKTSTPMGKRLLKYRICNPIVCPVELEHRYDQIEYFLKNIDFHTIENMLNEIIDIERLHRRMSLLLLHPHEFYQLCYSYRHIRSLMDRIGNEKSEETHKWFPFVQQDLFQEYLRTIDTLFEWEEMGKYGLNNITDSFFKIGVYEEIDTLQWDMKKIYTQFEEEAKYLSDKIEKDSSTVKIDYNDREGYYYTTTKKRWDVLSRKIDKSYECRKLNTSSVKIFNPQMTEKSHLYVEYKEKIQQLAREKYIDTLRMFYDTYRDLYLEMANYISVVDVVKSSVACVRKYRYTRPLLREDSKGQSYLEIKGLRHPIIEMIQQTGEYISNDITMNLASNGLLLYGVNGAGKSSFSKAVGCNLVLAQMGMYVACEEFVYFPFHKIFTRINGDDNIFKGMSSFVVEMNELRSILKYSDAHSIILGDEVCKGTEETSALSIVSSSILHFCQKNIYFIFATHLHKLMKLDCIRELQTVQCKHLTMEYDARLDTFIYNRKLKEGPGPEHYGIEIAGYIIDQPSFIENAKKIRHHLLDTSEYILNPKRSQYNKDVYMDKCYMCGAENQLDTHHIVEQKEFEEENVHKNKMSNLIVLCKKHHLQIHTQHTQIKYIHTVEGVRIQLL
jgi:DNA mismatch repair protein MutS